MGTCRMLPNETRPRGDGVEVVACRGGHPPWWSGGGAVGAGGMEKRGALWRSQTSATKVACAPFRNGTCGSATPQRSQGGCSGAHKMRADARRRRVLCWHDCARGKRQAPTATESPRGRGLTICRRVPSEIAPARRAGAGRTYYNKNWNVHIYRTYLYNENWDVHNMHTPTIFQQFTTLCDL